MKKLFLGLGIVLAMAACKGSGGNSSSQSDSLTVKSDTDSLEKSQKTIGGDTNAQPRVTLNGFSFDNADKMVKAFDANRNSHDALTTTWFSNTYVNDLLVMLHDEAKTVGTDGFRIYFARNAGVVSNAGGDNAYNIIIVSTKKVLKDIDGDGVAETIHEDYFEHDASFLSKAQGYIGHGAGIKGATSYLSIQQSGCPAACSPKPTTHYIDCNTTKARIQKMRDEPSGAKMNIISEWFDLGLLESIDSELKAAKPVNKADGMRIYFAKKETGEHCFIFVTTRDGGNNSHTDYHECYEHKFKEDNDNGEQCPYNCCGLTWPADNTCPPSK